MENINLAVDWLKMRDWHFSPWWLWLALTGVYCGTRNTLAQVETGQVSTVSSNDLTYLGTFWVMMDCPLSCLLPEVRSERVNSPLSLLLLGSPLCSAEHFSEEIYPLLPLFLRQPHWEPKQDSNLWMLSLDPPAFLYLPVLGSKMCVHPALWKVLESSFRLPPFLVAPEHPLGTLVFLRSISMEWSFVILVLVATSSESSLN